MDKNWRDELYELSLERMKTTADSLEVERNLDELLASVESGTVEHSLALLAQASFLQGRNIDAIVEHIASLEERLLSLIEVLTRQAEED